MRENTSPVKIPLLRPDQQDALALNQLLLKRKSHRNFKPQSITLKELSHLLWAAQGAVAPGRRTAPSAGAIFPFRILTAMELAPPQMSVGLYLFEPDAFRLKLMAKGAFREKLYQACMFQECILQAPLCVILYAKLTMVERVYGERAFNYIFLEGGHIGQNIYLAATALNLGTVAVGAFRDEMIRQILMLSADDIPVYLFPVGKPV